MKNKSIKSGYALLANLSKKPKTKAEIKRSAIECILRMNKTYIGRKKFLTNKDAKLLLKIFDKGFAKCVGN